MQNQSHNVIPYGPHAWLIQNLDPKTTNQLLTSLENSPPPHFQELTIGYDAILLQFQSPITKTQLLTHLQTFQEKSHQTKNQTLHKIPVIYNGPDLADIAAQLKITQKALIHLHSKPLYTVRFLGFSPGFAYLDGLPEKLHLPRRDTPRTHMETGAVAIGGPHAGIYTIPSPGGWHWLGNTETPPFSPEKNNPNAFLLNPGDKIKFVPK